MRHLPPQSVWFGLALLAALSTVVGVSRRRGVDVATAFGLFSLLVVSAIAGARALWCVAAPEAGLEVIAADPSLAWHPLRGGYASLGGWIGAVLVGLVATRGWSWPRRWSMADVFVPSGLIAMSLARVGCLSNGCDFGVVTSRGLRYPPGSPAYQLHLERGLIEIGASHSAATFPLPVVLAASTGVLAAVAIVAAGRLAVGRAALGASAAYFLMRFLVETFRAPVTADVIAGPLNANHVLAVIGLVVTAVAWRSLDRRRGSTDRPRE